jgi:hypothetical protein
MRRAITVAMALALATSGTGCWRGGGLGLFEAAVVTAAIVSTVQPPPPRVVFVPPPRDGYAWQPGYWTQQDGQWLWVDGGWVQARPQMNYVPSHWQQMPDGSWQLVPAQWMPA